MIIRSLFIILIGLLTGLCQSAHATSCINLSSNLNIGEQINNKINLYKSQSGSLTNGELCLRLPSGEYSLAQSINILTREFKHLEAFEITIEGHPNGTALQLGEPHYNYGFTLTETDSADDTVQVELVLRNLVLMGGPVAAVSGMGDPTDDPLLALEQVRIRENSSCLPSIWAGKGLNATLDNNQNYRLDQLNVGADNQDLARLGNALYKRDPKIYCPPPASRGGSEPRVDENPSDKPAGVQLIITDSAIFSFHPYETDRVYADSGVVSTISDSIIDDFRRMRTVELDDDFNLITEGCHVGHVRNFIERASVAINDAISITEVEDCGFVLMADTIPEANKIASYLEATGDTIRDYAFKNDGDGITDHLLIDKGKRAPTATPRDLSNNHALFRCYDNRRDIGPFEYQPLYDLEKNKACITNYIAVNSTSISGEFEIPLIADFACQLNDVSKQLLAQDFNLTLGSNTSSLVSNLRLENNSKVVIPYQVNIGQQAVKVGLTGAALTSANSCVDENVYYSESNPKSSFGVSDPDWSELSATFTEQETFINSTVKGVVPNSELISGVQVCLDAPVGGQSPPQLCVNVTVNGNEWAVDVRQFFIEGGQAQTVNLRGTVTFRVQYLNNQSQAIPFLSQHHQVYVDTADLSISQIEALPPELGGHQFSSVYPFNVVLNKLIQGSCNRVLTAPTVNLLNNYFNVSEVNYVSLRNQPENSTPKTHSVCRYEVTVNEGYPKYQDQLQFGIKVDVSGAPQQSETTFVEFAEPYFGNGGAHYSKVGGHRDFSDKLQAIKWRQTAQGSHEIKRLVGQYEGGDFGKQGTQGLISGINQFDHNECVVAARVALDDGVLSNMELMSTKRNHRLLGVHQDLSNRQDFVAPPGYHINGFDLTHSGEATGSIAGFRPRYSVLPDACYAPITVNTCTGGRARHYCSGSNANANPVTYSHTNGMNGFLGISLNSGEYLKGFRFSPSNPSNTSVKMLFDGYGGSQGSKTAKPDTSDDNEGALCITTAAGDRNSAECNSPQWRTLVNNQQLVVAPRGYYIDTVKTYSGTGGEGIFKVEVTFAAFPYTHTRANRVVRKIIPLITH